MRHSIVRFNQISGILPAIFLSQQAWINESNQQQLCNIIRKSLKYKFYTILWKIALRPPIIKTTVNTTFHGWSSFLGFYCHFVAFCYISITPEWIGLFGTSLLLSLRHRKPIEVQIPAEPAHWGSQRSAVLDGVWTYHIDNGTHHGRSFLLDSAQHRLKPG